jgi:hypothetical protein
MKSLRITLLAAAVSAMNIAHAQSVDEIQAKYVDALGGKDKINSLKTVYEETSTEVMGMTLPTRTWIIYGNVLRSEVDVQGQKIITYISKEKGWMVNPMTGSADPQQMPDDALKASGGRLQAGGEFFNYKENGYAATYAGKESVDGKACHKIKLSKDGAESTIFLDSATYYLVRTVAKANMMGQDIEQVVDFADYRKTDDGYLFPFKISTNNPQAGDIVNNVTKIDINKPIDPKTLEKND